MRFRGEAHGLLDICDACRADDGDGPAIHEAVPDAARFVVFAMGRVYDLALEPRAAKTLRQSRIVHDSLAIFRRRMFVKDNLNE